MNTARSGGAGAGTQTAALAFGGAISSPSAVGITESWDGNNWISSPPLATARAGIAGAGTQTAALAAAGRPSTGSPTGSVLTEEWTGTPSTGTASTLTTS